MSSFSTSLSGLNADSLDLNVISNNLANLNTTGYKDQTPVFQDLFYQQLGTNGAGDPIQVGVGSSVGSVSSNFTEGSIQNTGVPSDEAIQGSGFFVLQQNGRQVYTRDGTFAVNSDGLLVSSQGDQVMGYPSVNGSISQALAPLSVANGQVSQPQPTGNVSLSMNLDATAAVSTANPPPVSFSTSMEVYDSLGASHVLTFNFTKTAANSWNYEVTAPAADLGQTGAPVSLQTGTLGFNVDGSGALTSPAAGSPIQINLTGLSDGASKLSVNWNLYDSSGNPLITQVANSSGTSASSQDGYAGGTLLSFSVAQDGTIQGAFSNGQTVPLGQLALASFPNAQGLTLNGESTYSATLSSGVPNIGAPGTGGRGTVAGGALEESNVDIATEFANLITAERGYQANARAITVADSVTQAAINLQQ